LSPGITRANLEIPPRSDIVGGVITKSHSSIRALTGLAALLAAIFALSGIAEAADAGNPAKGETLFKSKCAICHETEAGKNKVGPSLHGVVGRKAGTAGGFNLYRGLRDASWTWDEAALNAYLTDPPAYTKDKNGKNATMVLRTGNPQERADIIAFLKTLK
jgi:cytochrome c